MNRHTFWGLKLPAIGLVLLMLNLAGCGGGGSASTPAAPTGVAATAVTSQANLSWATSPDATSYTIYYGPTAGVTKATATNSVTNVTATTSTVSGLLNGTTYYFVVTAVNGVGESVASSEVSVTPLAKPQGITVTAGDGQATVAWSPVTGATSYSIYYATSAGVTTVTGTPFVNAATPQVITGLTNGTTYYFVVVAQNGSGSSILSSEKSATPAVTPQPPPNPTGVAAAAGTGQVTVTWNTVIGADSYNVYYLQSATAVTTADVLANGAVQSAVASPAAIIGLAAGDTYWVVVTAVNTAGESGAQTNPKSATVL
jgi:fibronectin type 3 domain-containing protein